MFFKTVVLEKFPNIPRKTPVLKSLFNKIVTWRPATSLKKRLQYKCFPVNLAKVLRTAFLTKHLWRQLLVMWISTSVCHKNLWSVMKSRAQNHHSLKLGSKLKYLKFFLYIQDIDINFIHLYAAGYATFNCWILCSTSFVDECICWNDKVCR